MSYTQGNLQDWIFYIDDKMDSFTEEFAKKNNLDLDYSIKSLDGLESWIINTVKDRFELKENPELLDLLTIYTGETFRKHIGGKWFMDTEDNANAYYMMPVLTTHHLLLKDQVAKKKFKLQFKAASGTWEDLGEKNYFY